MRAVPRPLAVDDTYIVGKVEAVGMRGSVTGQVSAEMVESTDGRTLTRFVHDQTKPDTMVFNGEAPASNRQHRRVRHGIKEFINCRVHTNGIESGWAMSKRSYVVTGHHFSSKHLPRYVAELTGRLKVRDLDTEEQRGALVENRVGKRLTLAGLIGLELTRQLALI